MDRLERYEEIERLYELQEWDHTFTVIADTVREQRIINYTVYESVEIVLDCLTSDNLDLDVTTEFGQACKRLLDHFNIK